MDDLINNDMKNLISVGNHCGVDFDIRYMTAAEFMDCFDVGSRKAYLERYRLSKKY